MAFLISNNLMRHNECSDQWQLFKNYNLNPNLNFYFKLIIHGIDSRVYVFLAMADEIVQDVRSTDP